LINFKRRRRFGRALHEVIHPLSGRDRRRHTREHFMQTRCDKLFYLIFDRIPREIALTSLTIENGKALDDALAQGRGAYVALCHHGPLHVSGMLMTIRGYKVAGVRDRREGALRRYVQSLYDLKYPEFRRARILYADSFPREIYRCLQDGYALGSAMDISRVRDPRQKHHEVKMFNRPQVFLTGPLRIALRCKSPILQAFIVPGRDFQYRLIFVDGLLNPEAGGTSDEEASIIRAIEIYAARVERHVRQYPSLLTRA
jgi:lauroyl/myristoyl acyltransferase